MFYHIACSNVPYKRQETTKIVKKVKGLFRSPMLPQRNETHEHFAGPPLPKLKLTQIMIYKLVAVIVDYRYNILWDNGSLQDISAIDYLKTRRNRMLLTLVIQWL